MRLKLAGILGWYLCGVCLYPITDPAEGNLYWSCQPRISIYTLSGQKYFNTFKLCHIVEICMPLKLFVLKITSNVLIYLIIG